VTFRLADPDALYPVDASIDVPTERGFEPRPCRLLFRMMSIEEESELAAAGDREYLAGVLGGWDGIEDHDGSPLEFGADNAARLGRVSYFVVGVQRAYRAWLLALPGKTSPRPRGTGASQGAEAATH